MARFKRKGYKHNLQDGAVCMNDDCDNVINYYGGGFVRSNTWWTGMVGARAVLCSEDCQQAFDDANLTYIQEQEDVDA